MKTIFLVIIMGYQCLTCFCQKPALDSAIMKSWPIIKQPALTPDGRYILYSIANLSNGVEGSKSLVLQSADSSWKLEIPGIRFPVFTKDSKRAIFQQGDSFGIVTLGESAVRYVPHVRSYSSFGNQSGYWIAYLKSDENKSLVLENLTTNKSFNFSNIKGFRHDVDGTTLVMYSEAGSDSAQTIQWLDVKTLKVKTIWSGKMVDGVTIDPSGTRVAFLSEEQSDNKRALWIYDRGMQTAKMIIHPDSLYADGVLITSVQEISKIKDLIFISVEKINHQSHVQTDKVGLTLWKYTDPILASTIYARKRTIRPRLLVFNTRENRLNLIADFNDEIIDRNDTSLIVLHCPKDNDRSEWYWNPACKTQFFMKSALTGAQKKILEWNYGDIALLMSPDGKFAVYYNPASRNYFSFEFSTSITRNITKSIKTDWVQYNTDQSYLLLTGVNPMGWLTDKSSVILMDRSDIWLVDLFNHTPPVNITHGIGRKSNLFFNLIPNQVINLFSSRDKMIVPTFNRNNKNSGFYSISISGEEVPVQLSMGPWSYVEPVPKKKSDSLSLVVRMSASNSSNVCLTRDFFHFQQLTHLNPEKMYNWLSAELVNWNSLDGKMIQGILYKPENFDSAKKYPLILYYYEKLSDRLNDFLIPQESADVLNIPWMVSNGYCVFTPDIHYRQGYPGESAYNSIISATQFLSKRKYIDCKHIGLQGHSYGGYETNYVITHSHLFAAACSASGISDLISGYNALSYVGNSRQFNYEQGQSRMQSPPWSNTALYIKNSPVFYLDKVTTPVLIMHNKNDERVPFEQGVELFLGLRRLQKKAWMLQYKNSTHSVDGPEAIHDYTQKMTEFFDHFLKNKPAPEWLGD